MPLSNLELEMRRFRAQNPQRRRSRSAQRAWEEAVYNRNMAQVANQAAARNASPSTSSGNAVQRRVNQITGVSSAGARRRESNRIRQSMRNAARRVSSGGNGG